MSLEVIRVSEISIDEAHYVKQTLAGLWDELPTLLAGALTVSVLGAPLAGWGARGALLPAGAAAALLAAPAWSAYCYLVGRAAIGEKPALADLPRAFRHVYLRSLVSTLPVALLTPVVAYFAPGLALNLPLPVTVGIVLQILVLLVLAALLVFVFPLLALFDLPLRRAWANGLYLALRWPWVALGLLSMAVLLVFLAGKLGIGFWPVIPLVVGAFNVNAVLMLTRNVLAAGQ